MVYRMTSDRYQLAREFQLQAFEHQIMKTEDLYALQVMCIKLYSQTLAQRRVYEELLKEKLGFAHGKD